MIEKASPYVGVTPPLTAMMASFAGIAAVRVTFGCDARALKGLPACFVSVENTWSPVVAGVVTLE